MTKQQQTEYQYAKENAAKWRAMAERNEHPGRSFCLTQVGNWEAKANRIAAAPDLEANARLIAAAPELLAALESIAAILNLPVQYTSSQSADQDVAQVLILRTDSRVARNVARAAIAAATGAGE